MRRVSRLIRPHGIVVPIVSAAIAFSPALDHQQRAISIASPPSGSDGFVQSRDSFGSDGIPVEAVYVRTPEENISRDTYGVLHAVRRVPGATIAYVSHGFSEYKRAKDAKETFGKDLYGESSYSFKTAMIIDPPSGDYWFPLRNNSKQSCLCPDLMMSPGFREDINSTDEGDAWDGLWTFAIAFPPLPDDVSTVDISVSGDGQIIRDVSVGDGALEPMAEPDPSRIDESFRYFQKISTAGWPYIPDQDYFSDVIHPKKTRNGTNDTEVPLTGAVVEYVSGGELVADERSSGRNTEYTVAADVAFEFDSDVVTDKFQKILGGLEPSLKETESPIRIIGYTDNQGSTDYNLDLSRRRAESVAKEISALSPDVQVEVEGRGEQDPVATNSTEDGRASNRRVVVRVEK